MQWTAANLLFLTSFLPRAGKAEEGGGDTLLTEGAGPGAKEKGGDEGGGKATEVEPATETRPDEGHPTQGRT